MVDDPRFSSNSRRCAHRDELDAQMKSALDRFDRAAMAQALERANIAFGRYNDVGEFARHPQLRRVEIATRADRSACRRRRRSSTANRQRRTLAAIGAHSAAIRSEFARRRREPRRTGGMND